MKKFFSLLLLTLCFLPQLGLAQDDYGVIYSGTVDQVLETTYPLDGLREVELQRLQVTTEHNQQIEIMNDYTPLQAGDSLYYTKQYDPYNQSEAYFVEGVNRLWPAIIVFAIFVVIYISLSGIKGLRSIASLAISVLAVFYILIPMIVSGYSPLVAGFWVSLGILGVAIFVTHGLTIVSAVSYIGSTISIGLTTMLAIWSMDLLRISGYVADTSNALVILYGDTINLQGLLLAGIIIGILGVLDDVAVMQAAMVREFFAEQRDKANVVKIFWKAMRVGQEHTAALVNTLVLAYTGVALPLFLIVLAPQLGTLQGTGYEVPLLLNLSNEVFVAEFLRSVIGSIGLIITVPLVTVLAVWAFSKIKPTEKGEGHVCMHHHH